MTLSDEKLLAYADGLLSPAEIAGMDRLLADDPDARETIAALEQSALPSRETAIALIDVPDFSHIADHIQSYQPLASPSRLSRFAPLAASIAVFFVVGLLAGQHIFPPSAPKPTQWAVWVDRIASYQALYTRAVSPSNPPDSRKVGQMLRVSELLGTTIKAPDLAPVDADYKYAKVFAIDGRPLA